MIKDISDIFRRMSHAAMRAGRSPESVRLVAVSKTVSPELMHEAYDAGLRLFGESRVQEVMRKTDSLGGLSIEWHMLGHLQRNKAKSAVRIFSLIQSVDSVELMETIDRHAADAGKIQRVLIQVKLSDEAAKSGASGRGAEELLKRAQGLRNIRVEGLMGIPPYFDEPERARPYFRRLCEINKGFGLPELSMGMSGDFEIAIEEGATLVRIGTLIFGEREKA